MRCCRIVLELGGEQIGGEQLLSLALLLGLLFPLPSLKPCGLSAHTISKLSSEHVRIPFRILIERVAPINAHQEARSTLRVKADIRTAALPERLLGERLDDMVDVVDVHRDFGEIISDILTNRVQV